MWKAEEEKGVAVTETTRIEDWSIRSDYVYRSLEDFPEFQMLEYYLKDVRNTAYIAGGVFKDILRERVWKDIDFFCETYTHWTTTIKAVRQLGYRPNFLSAHAEGFIHPTTEKPVEVIHNRFEPIIDRLQSFDFVAAQCAMYWDELAGEYTLLMHRNFVADVRDARLTFRDGAVLSNPVGTLERTIRYANYGFKMDPEAMSQLYNLIQSQEEPSTAKNFIPDYDNALVDTAPF